MKETHLKGLTHAALALLGLYEITQSTSNARKLVTGCLIGWHAHATLYHMLFEEEE